MDLKGLQTGLLGFKKKDVCEYIAQMNEELNTKLHGEEKEFTQTISALNKKNEELHEEIARLTSENDQLMQKERNSEDKISSLKETIKILENAKSDFKQSAGDAASVLLDARSFANELKSKALREHDEMCRKNDEEKKAAIKRLSEYKSEIDKIHSAIANTLMSMDEALLEMSYSISTLQKQIEGDLSNG